MVINKVDIMRPEDLDPATSELLQGMLKDGEVELLTTSCVRLSIADSGDIADI